MSNADPTDAERSGGPRRRAAGRRDATRGVGPVLLVVALLAVAAATAGALRTRAVDGDVASRVDLGLLGDRWSQNLFVSILAVATLGSLVCGVLLARIRMGRREPDEDEDEPTRPAWWRRWLTVLVPIVLLGLVFAAAAERDPPPPPTAPAPTLAPAEGTSASEPPPPVDWWFVVLVVVVSGGAAVVVARRWRPRPSPSRRGPADAAAVLDAVDESLDALLAEPDHRRAVVAAYARMEAVLARAGVARQGWEAPTEYLERVLHAAGARAATARTLTGLFAHARFSAHPVDRAMRDEAVRALVALRDELAGVDLRAEADAAAPGRPSPPAGPR